MRINTIYADGGGDGTVCVIKNDESPIIYIFDNLNSHNEVEWMALISALAETNMDAENYIYLDSLLVVNQFNGVYKVRAENLKRFYDGANKLLELIKVDIRVLWVPRGENLAGIHLERMK